MDNTKTVLTLSGACTYTDAPSLRGAPSQWHYYGAKSEGLTRERHPLSEKRVMTPNMPKIVLSTGTPARPLDQPAPARLVVAIELGHSFRALPLDGQRRMVEDALGVALGLTLDKLDEMHAHEHTQPEVTAA